MKKLPLLLTLSFMSACGDGKNSSSTSKSNNNEVATTNFVQANEVICNYNNGELQGRFESLNNYIINGYQQTRFEALFELSLTNNIVNELRDYSKANGKISAKDFWNIISSSGRQHIEAEILKKFSSYNDKQYNLKRKLIAYAFTYYSEITPRDPKAKEYRKAIRFKSSHHPEFKEFIIAFNNDVREIIDLDICEIDLIDRIDLPKESLMPSDIVTNIVCKIDEGNDTAEIVFQVHKDENLYINLKTGNIVDHIVLDKNRITTKTRRSYKSYKYKDQNYDVRFDIYKRNNSTRHYNDEYRSFIYNTIDYMNLNLTRHGHSSFKFERLDCTAVKAFTI